MGPESEIQTQILLHFGALPWLRIWRANTGKVNMAKRGEPPRWVQYGVVGQPDIMGLMLPHGRAIGIEVKSSVGKQREAQKRFEEMFVKFGGLYVLARSVADVQKVLHAPAL
jgi:hypothetical protein